MNHQLAYMAGFHPREDRADRGVVRMIPTHLTIRGALAICVLCSALATPSAVAAPPSAPDGSEFVTFAGGGFDRLAGGTHQGFAQFREQPAPPPSVNDGTSNTFAPDASSS